MKKTKILALLSTLGVLAGSTALAQSSADTDATRAQPPQPQEPQGWNGPNPQARQQALLEKYDANKDGKLDESELAAIGNDVEQGKFEPRLLMRRPGGPAFGQGARAPRGRGFGPGPRWQGGRGFGPGPLAQNEPGFGPGPRGPRGPGPGYGPGPRGSRAFGGPGFGPRHQEMLQKYDANKDGVLDESERAAIRKDIEDGKLQRPGFGPGPLRPGPPPGPDAPVAPDAPAQPPAPEQ